MITADTTSAKTVEREHPVRLMLRKVGQFRCKHSYLLVRQGVRIFLQCSNCGRETRGIEVIEQVGQSS